MKNKFLKLFSMFGAVILIIFMFAGCGASEKSYNYVAEDSVAYEDNASVSVSGSTATSDTVSDNRKIIENIDLSVQTKEFDTLLENVNKQITELGGYVESSSIYGREYNSNNTRTAEITIRIPADKSGDFTNFVSENSVIVRKSVSTEDVTLQYVDMESRVEVLEAEKESLENLLKSAATMSDIIAVREKLTEVIETIESYKSQLRTYDNLVSYSTVYIEIDEVERTVVVEKQNIWQKIGTNLKNNFANVWNATVSIFIFFVSCIPYLIPFAIIAAIVVVIILINSRKNRKKQ